MSRPTLTEDEMAILRLFGPNTYSIKLPYDKPTKELIAAGCIAWVPSWLPGGADYAITKLGEACRDGTP